MSTLSPMSLLLGATACIVCALALGVLAYARRQTNFQAVNQHLERTIERQVMAGATNAAAMDVSLPDAFMRTQAAPRPEHTALKRWASLLRLQAWGVSRNTAWILALCGIALAAVATLRGGMALGMIVLLVYTLLVAFFLWRRLDKQRQRMLEQLPGFLDNMVRLITIGNSPQASFQMAVATVQAPLLGALQQASSVLVATSNLSLSMEQLERTWRLPEFGLLAAVFRMSTKYGGRTDQVLDRVSAYIRDRLSAERELHAMSAEVRLSAWILSLLPIVVGALIMFLNEGYFMRMWNDESGRQMIALAAGLEVAGVLLLYRLAKLR